jgi:intracellular multiplication protein IcmD
MNKKMLLRSGLLLLICLPLSTFAAESLGDVAANVTASLSNIAKLISAASYVAGVGFALMGLLKFKAHKDQPQQVPLSQPIVLIAIAAGLIYMPSVIKMAGATMWGGNAQVAGIGDTTTVTGS